MFIASFSLKSFVQGMLYDIREILDFPTLHPVREMRIAALRETIDYIQGHMTSAIGVKTPKALLDAALRHCRIDGQFLEFGVYRGGTISYLARKRPGATFHGFDSFEGLPEAWRGYNLAKGAFDLSGRLPEVPENVRLHKGWFDETLPKWIKENPGPIAFLHVDCDLYSSTKTLFDNLNPQLVPGTVIVFDEYFNYPGWRQNEYQALQEFVAANQIGYTYIAYSRFQVAIEITARG